MKTVFRYLLACALMAAAAAAQTDFAGHWEGAVDVSAGPTRLALDLAKNEKGVWVASRVCRSGGHRAAATDISVMAAKIRFARRVCQAARLSS